MTGEKIGLSVANVAPVQHQDSPSGQGGVAGNFQQTTPTTRVPTSQSTLESSGANAEQLEQVDKASCGQMVNRDENQEPAVEQAPMGSTSETQQPESVAARTTEAPADGVRESVFDEGYAASLEEALGTISTTDTKHENPVVKTVEEIGVGITGEKSVGHPHLSAEINEAVQAYFNPEKKEIPEGATQAFVDAFNKDFANEETGSINFKKLGLDPKVIKSSKIKGTVFVKNDGSFDFKITGKCGKEAMECMQALKDKLEEIKQRDSNFANIPININPATVGSLSQDDKNIITNGGQIQYRILPDGNVMKLILDPSDNGKGNGLSVGVYKSGEGNTLKQQFLSPKIPLDVVFDGAALNGKKVGPFLEKWRERNLFENSFIHVDANLMDTKIRNTNEVDIGRIQSQNALWEAVNKYLKVSDVITEGHFEVSNTKNEPPETVTSPIEAQQIEKGIDEVEFRKKSVLAFAKSGKKGKNFATNSIDLQKLNDKIKELPEGESNESFDTQIAEPPNPNLGVDLEVEEKKSVSLDELGSLLDEVVTELKDKDKDEDGYFASIVEEVNLIKKIIPFVKVNKGNVKKGKSPKELLDAAKKLSEGIRGVVDLLVQPGKEVVAHSEDVNKFLDDVKNGIISNMDINEFFSHCDAKIETFEKNLEEKGKESLATFKKNYQDFKDVIQKLSEMLPNTNSSLKPLLFEFYRNNISVLWDESLNETSVQEKINLVNGQFEEITNSSKEIIQHQNEIQGKKFNEFLNGINENSFARQLAGFGILEALHKAGMSTSNTTAQEIYNNFVGFWTEHKDHKTYDECLKAFIEEKKEMNKKIARRSTAQNNETTAAAFRP